MEQAARKRVIFICTHNSARSQMAEGWLRELAGDRYEVHSAGTEATAVRPEAAAVMQEAGVDISSHTSKTLDEYIGQRFDYVITVCDQAAEACPVFPGGGQRLHWSFSDPSAAGGTGQERMEVFRAVRDSIRRRIEQELIGTAET